MRFGMAYDEVTAALADESECALDVEAAQERHPGPVRILGCGIDAGPWADPVGTKVPAVDGWAVFGCRLLVTAYSGSGREAACSSPLSWVR